MPKIINEWDRIYICNFCGSDEHTLYPVMRGKYKDYNVFACSTCDSRIWRGEELKLKRYLKD